MIVALELYKSVSRYLAARAVGGRTPGALAGPMAPLRLVNQPEPTPTTPGWGRLRPRLSGICGSDLATLSGQSSLYLSPLVSTPFVPGHEVVGELVDEVAGLSPGTRVVLDPVLSCGPRGLSPCAQCAASETSRCDHITVGDLSAGLQSGYCADTGGGWAHTMLAHRDQVHPVPDALTDEQAVLVEPLACAVHAVRRARFGDGDQVLVVGAGTVGLLVLVALRALTEAARIMVVAKHPRQQELADAFGATTVVSPDRAPSALRRATRAFMLRPERGQPLLLGGAGTAFECTGGRAGLDLATRSVAAGGQVVLAGMPTGSADLAPVWFRELELTGAYASRGRDGGKEQDGRDDSDFATALELAAGTDLSPLVGGIYPLASWRQALDHAYSAGTLGTFKIAFAPQQE